MAKGYWFTDRDLREAAANWTPVKMLGQEIERAERTREHAEKERDGRMKDVEYEAGRLAQAEQHYAAEVRRVEEAQSGRDQLIARRIEMLRAEWIAKGEAQQ